MKSGRGEHKPVKKQSLTWQSRMLFFQSSLWKSRKKQKEQKQVLMFARLSAEKESSDACHAIEKAKSKRTEVTELYFFHYNEQNQLASILLMQSSYC